MKIKISPELARIVAHICGDGYIRKGKQRRTEAELLTHPRKNIFKNKYYVRYVNTEKTLANQFIRDVKKELNRVVIKLRKYEYEVSGKWVYDLVVHLGAGKSREWFISKEIFDAKKNIKIEWLKAFFDDEAHVSTNSKKIILSIINKKGIKQIKRMLSQIGVTSQLRGPYSYTFRSKKGQKYYLIIPKKEIIKYSTIIGFYHPNKAKALRDIVNKINKNGAVGNFHR